MFNLISVLILAFALFQRIDAVEDPIVQLPKGKIRGHILKSEDGKPYYAFQEIPYAAPPIGSNRFKEPKEPQPWSGILNTTKNNVICYQPKYEHPNFTKSEDCLFLNVYSPVPPGSSKKLPVIVWIHGGRFMRHAGIFEFVGPKYVVNHGVVVVSLNYRMGPFGFLSTDDDVMPANLGLKDQHLALEWVHENIGLFGGNNSHITIAGESAGAMSISLHILGPWKNNKELYQAAILESGALLFISRSNRVREEAFTVGKFLDKNFSSASSKDLLKVLQKASPEELLEATKNKSVYMPIVEKDGLIKYQTWEALVQGNVKKIPILLGFNSEEWLFQASTPNIKQIAAALDNDPSRMIGSTFNISAVNRTIAGNLMKKIYTTNFEQNIGAYIRYISDNIMTTPITKLGFLQSKYADVYLYQFAYKGELGGQMNLPKVQGCERVGHAEELDYIWSDGRNTDLTKFPVADRLMLHRVTKLWTNFVKYHNPTPEKDSLLENIQWSKINPNITNNIPYLNMNVTLEVRSNPRYYQKVNALLERFVSPKDII